MKKLGRSIVNKSVKILVLLLLLTSSFKGFGQCEGTGGSRANVSCFGQCNGSVSGRIYNCPSTNGIPGSDCTPPTVDNFGD